MDREEERLEDNIYNKFEYEIELINKIESISLVNNVYQKEAYIEIQKYHYKYLEKRDENIHLEKMRDKDIELKKMEYEHKENILDKEIMLKRMELEMMKMKK